MPGRSTHLIFGVISSVIIALMIYSAALFYAVIGGAIGSILPDTIKPVDHYTHRNFFHSWDLLKYLLIVTLISLVLSFFVSGLWYVFYGCIGYLSHLLADATTEMGLS